MAERPLTQEMLDRRSYGQGSRARFDPQWAMSRPEKWYQNKANLGLIKDTLVRQPAVTTDPNEQRNMYQMLMNQIKGGGGARLIDTSGLPAGARRTGRTLFTDPAKSQGFFGDVGSLFTGKNRAAIRDVREYNPFPNFGQQGKDWYKKEFPYASGLGSLMEAAENFIPYAGMVKRMFSKEREPLERDPRFLPENNMAPFWELLEDEAEDAPLQDLFLPWNDLWKDGEDDLLGEDFTEPLDDITEKIVEESVDEPLEKFTDLGDTHMFTENFGMAFDATDYADVQEYVNSILQDETNPYYGMDQDELVKELIKQNRIKEK